MESEGEGSAEASGVCEVHVGFFRYEVSGLLHVSNAAFWKRGRRRWELKRPSKTVLDSAPGRQVTSTIFLARRSVHLYELAWPARQML